MKFRKFQILLSLPLLLLLTLSNPGAVGAFLSPEIGAVSQIEVGDQIAYTNSAGQEVKSPVYSKTVPAGASAKCKDGTYSFSKKRSGTCSGHKGVSQWIKVLK